LRIKHSTLILIDLIMPEIDGTDLCEQIKQARPDVCVYAYSGHAHLYDPERLVRAGFDGAIGKPATIEEIKAALNRAGTKAPMIAFHEDITENEKDIATMLKKIISGGQTGVDRAALDVAMRLGIAHGGWIPKGRLAEDGPLPPHYQCRKCPRTNMKPARKKMCSIQTAP
jgi:response regulator of citrate/malate metabolism